MLRKETNITQGELAQKLGIARSTLPNIELGVNMPKGELGLIKIGRCFGKPVEQIFFD